MKNEHHADAISLSNRHEAIFACSGKIPRFAMSAAPLPSPVMRGCRIRGDLIGKDDFQMNWREQAELYRADDKPVIDSDTLKFGIEKPKRRAKRRG